MSDTLVARRYARALFDLATQSSSLESTDADIDLIAETMAGSRDLVNLFDSPVISRPKKEAVTRELFSSRISDTTSDFLSMLIGKRREVIFLEIVGAYRALRDEQQGVVEATARSASSLSTEELDNLRSSLEKMTGKRVRLNTVVDESLVGGVSVKVGDTVYDGSVKNQLEGLRATFQMHSTASSN